MDEPSLALEPTAAPPVQQTLAAIAERINTWGRIAVDPTIPAVEPAADERSVRFGLKAMDEAVVESRTLWDEHFRGWTLIHSALQEASLVSGSTVHSFDDGDRALKWYVALLYLERARTVWAEHVGRPLAAGTT